MIIQEQVFEFSRVLKRVEDFFKEASKTRTSKPYPTNFFGKISIVIRRFFSIMKLVLKNFYSEIETESEIFL